MPRFIIIAALFLALAGSSTLVADPKSDAKQLAADRVAAATKVLDAMTAERGVGVGSWDEVPVWSLRLLDAQLDDPARASKQRALQDHLDRMTQFRDDVAVRAKAMAVSQRAVFEAEYYVAEAKLWVARGKK